MRRRLIVFLGAAILWSMPAYSHHSPASHYELDKSIIVEGKVTRFRLINPHVRIYFTVTTETGEAQPWLAEGNAAAILKRRGWTKETLKPGDYIKITGSPARDGGNKLDWSLIELADGTILYGGNTVGVEAERQIDELDKRRRRERSERLSVDPPVVE